MTILDSPSAAAGLDVERFPTAVLPKAQVPMSGNELVAILQSGNNVYAGVTDLGGGGAGSYAAGVSNLGNTAGQTGLNTKALVLAGFLALSLSQATDANGATISLSAPVQTQQTQNVFDLTIGGNTAGVGQLISSGTLFLAGGPNVTLSQNGQSITISAPAPVGGNFSAGVSTGGNTLGSTGVSGTRVVFAGGNSVTLSQSTDANGATVTISGATTPSQTAESQTFGMSNLGNTAGTSGVISGPQLRMLVVGGPNVTASQSINGSSATISLSVAAQSVQTQGQFSAGASNLGNTAGSTGITGTRLIFVGTNGISLSQSTDANGGTLSINFTQSVQTQNLFALTISSGTAGVGALVSSGTLTLAGGANITLSQNAGNAITIIGPSPSGGAFSAGVSNLGNTAGSTGLSGTQLVLVGTNAISLSQSTGANGATVSINFTQSVQTQGQMSAGVSNLGNTAGSTGVTGTRLVFVGTNGISLSQSTDANGGTLSINFTQSAESNTLGISNLGNTAGTSGVISGNQLRLLLAGGNNVTLSQSINGASATITVSAFNQTVQTQNLHNVTLAGNSTSAGAGFIQISSGTLTLAGGNNVTLSQNGNAVTISAFNQSVQTQNLVDVTLAGNSTSAGAGFILISSGTLTLAGGNNITLSQNGNAVSISAFTQTVQTQNLFALTISSNTAGVGALISSGTLSLAGGANITLSQNGGNAVTIIGGAGGAGFSAGASNLGNTAGSTGITGTRLVFVGTNAVSLSQSTDANGGTLSINVTIPAQTVESQSIGASNLGNTLGTSGVASGAQVRAIIIGTSNITVSQSVNGASATLSLIGQPAFSGGVSTGGNTAGATGISGTQLVLVGSNNITLSQTTGANGATVSIFGGAGGAGFSAGVSNLGNTAGSTGITGTRLVFAGSNGITLRQSTDANGGTITVSALTSVVHSIGVSNIGNTGGSTNVVNFNYYLLVGSNNITLSQTTDVGGNGTCTIWGMPSFSAGVSTGGNTAGATGISGTQLVLVGSNNITLSQTTGANGATVSVFGGAGGAAFSAGVSNLGNTAGSTGITGTQLVLVGTNGILLSQSTNANGGTVSAGDAITLSYWSPLGINIPEIIAYSDATMRYRPISAERYVSASRAVMAMSFSMGSTGTITATISWGVGIYTLNGATLSAASVSTTSYGISYTSTQSRSSYHGGRNVSMSFNMNLSPGNYWIGHWVRSSGGQMTLSGLWAPLPIAPMGAWSGDFGAASAASEKVAMGMGVHSATVTNIRSSNALTDIRGTTVVDMRMPFLMFGNTTA